MAGVDFNETFAPMAKLITFKCILTLIATMNWGIHQMHANTFLIGYWRWRLYELYGGFHTRRGKNTLCANSRKFCTGSGNRQARDTTVSTRPSLTKGFYRSQTDHSLYVKQTNEYLLVANIYVDDLIILSRQRNPIEVVQIKAREGI